MSIHQDARPPFTMRCAACDATWEPAPNTRGEHTPRSLDQSAKQHWTTCPARERNRP